MNLDDTLAEFLELYPNVSNNQPACTLHAFKCWYWSTRIVNKQEDNNKDIVKEKRETIEEEQEKNKK